MWGGEGSCWGSIPGISPLASPLLSYRTSLLVACVRWLGFVFRVYSVGWVSSVEYNLAGGLAAGCGREKCACKVVCLCELRISFVWGLKSGDCVADNIPVTRELRDTKRRVRTMTISVFSKSVQVFKSERFTFGVRADALRYRDNRPWAVWVGPLFLLIADK